MNATHLSGSLLRDTGDKETVISLLQDSTQV